jgi:hypothetical protein
VILSSYYSETNFAGGISDINGDADGGLEEKAGRDTWYSWLGYIKVGWISGKCKYRGEIS